MSNAYWYAYLAWGWTSTCSWRSVTHQLNRPSLTHSTFPSWLTNTGLCRVRACSKLCTEVWWEPASTELFSLGEEAKKVRNHRGGSSGRADLDALAEEHRLKHSGENVHIRRLQGPTSGDNFSVIRVSTLYCFLCSLVLYLNGWFDAF